MSHFPDCRTDETYNESKLKGWRADAVRGYDMAAFEVDCPFDNLEVYPDVEEILDPDKAIVNKDKVAMLREAVQDWLETKRNEMITGFLDGQSCEEEAQGKE